MKRTKRHAISRATREVVALRLALRLTALALTADLFSPAFEVEAPSPRLGWIANALRPLRSVSPAIDDAVERLVRRRACSCRAGLAERDALTRLRCRASRLGRRRRAA